MTAGVIVLPSVEAYQIYLTVKTYSSWGCLKFYMVLLVIIYA